MENQLAVIKERHLSTRKEVAGLENFPNKLVRIPRLIIGQPGNLSGYEPSVFTNNLTNETYKEINVVLLKMQRSRTLWPSGKPKSGDQPVCRASDAKIPDQNFFGKLCQFATDNCNDAHQQCEDTFENVTCNHAMFKAGKYGGRPDCRLAYHLLLISADTGDAFILTVSGKSLAPTNKLLSSFKVKGKPAYSAIFKIKLEDATDGSYCVIHYSDFKWLDSEDELKEIFDKFKQRPITSSGEDQESNDSEKE